MSFCFEWHQRRHFIAQVFSIEVIFLPTDNLLTVLKSDSPFEAHFKQKALFDELNLEWLVALQGSCRSSVEEAGDPVPVLCHADWMLECTMGLKA